MPADETGKYLPWFIFAAAFLSISPLIAVIFPFQGNVFSLFFLMLAFFALAGKMGARTISLLLYILVILAATLLLSWTLKNIYLLLLPIPALLFLVSSSKKKSLLSGLGEQLDVLLVMLSKFKLSRNALTLSLLCICLALINSIYWQEFTAKIQIYFVSALIIVKLLNLKQMSEITRISSDVHLALLVLGIVGFVYAKSGGPAIFYIANEDTRLNGFYLTTFSNTYTFGFIRPSGIYDEPGALSFVVCFTVALRELFGMGRKMSWALMLLGLITGSLAHLIFLICFLLQVSSSKMVLKYLLYLVFCIGLIFSFDNPIADLVDSFGDRLTIVDGGLKGDNRSELLGNAIKYLSVDSFFWGLEGSCIANTPECDPQKYDRFLGNPLTLLVYTGLLVSLPYYGGLLLMLGLSIYKHDYLMLGAMLLLFQRPYSLSYGYCILILLYLVAYMSVANANKPQRGI